MRLFPEISADCVAFVTSGQMREVDRLMIDRYGIVLLQMMENAGRSLALVARDRFLGGSVVGHRVVVLAGSGGNGGGGLACARRLNSWGADVQVVLARPRNLLQPVTAHQLNSLEKMQVAVRIEQSHDRIGHDWVGRGVDLVIDAILGYSLVGAPRAAAANLIEAANARIAPVVALDVPSGVDATTGETPGIAVRADATLTLALPKAGLRKSPGRSHAGEMYLADIGVPPSVYADVDPAIKLPPIFAKGDILRVV